MKFFSKKYLVVMLMLLTYTNGFARSPETSEDGKKVVARYRKAAEGGDTKGMFSLGVMYQDGRGVPKNQKQAEAWFRKAKESVLK